MPVEGDLEVPAVHPCGARSNQPAPVERRLEVLGLRRLESIRNDRRLDEKPPAGSQMSPEPGDPGPQGRSIGQVAETPEEAADDVIAAGKLEITEVALVQDQLRMPLPGDGKHVGGAVQPFHATVRRERLEMNAGAAACVENRTGGGRQPIIGPG